MKADIKLCASLFSVVTLPVFYAWSRSSSRSTRASLESWFPSHFASFEDIFPWGRKLIALCGCQSWNATPVFEPNSADLLICDASGQASERGSVLWQHWSPRHTVCENNVKWIRESFQRRPHTFVCRVSPPLTPPHSPFHDVLRKGLVTKCPQASNGPKDNMQESRLKKAVCFRNTFPHWRWRALPQKTVFL